LGFLSNTSLNLKEKNVRLVFIMSTKIETVNQPLKTMSHTINIFTNMQMYYHYYVISVALIIIMMQFFNFVKIFELKDIIFFRTIFINEGKLSLFHHHHRQLTYNCLHFVIFMTWYMVSYIRLVVQSNAYSFLCSSIKQCEIYLYFCVNDYMYE
jgi:hypothetical protein